MATVTQAEIAAILLARNPPARRADCEQYAAVFVTWAAAQRNIDKNGAIVLHPKTGAPIENPHLAVRERAMRQLDKLGGRRGARLRGTEALPWSGEAEG
jgi:phage terminase small subunit